MLFMDALELDSFDCRGGLFVPDLLPGNVDRELRKAHTSFSSGPRMPSSTAYSEVITGLWGCRAFGGNKEIKILIQWCAASIANVPLTFVCSTDEVEFLMKLRALADRAEEGRWNVGDVLRLLRTFPPESEHTRSFLDQISRIQNVAIGKRS